MSSLTSLKKAEDAVSSSEPEPENWDRVFEVFFFKSLRCLINSLLEGKSVLNFDFDLKFLLFEILFDLSHFEGLVFL